MSRPVLFLSGLLLCILISSASLRNTNGAPPTPPHHFTLGDKAFLLDGKPFQIIAGEMHYTRIPREAWRDRMRMAKAMGLNTIGTYVFWNVSEPEKGVFNFTGNNDIAAFIRMAREEGLWVILRPSPYVCAEWEFGGYPYWLQNEPGLIVRSREPHYIKEYKAYIKEVGKQLAPLQVNHGGNILMVQIENEYGSYGHDKEYLDLNRNLFIDAGFDGLLFTGDPAKDVAKGYLPGLLPAVNGLDDPRKVKDTVNKYHAGKGPYYISEWYPAWFDWWGTPHHTVPAANYAAKLDAILSAGVSINMYMFHGGTTRGFLTGANYNDHDPFEPQVSSYDYDAPLDEAGNPTPKFRLFREIIQKHLPADVHLPDVPAPKPTISIPSIHFTDEASLFDHLPTPKHADTPMTFEDLHQAYGFVLYRTVLKKAPSGRLTIKGLRDYAIVFVNGRKFGVLDRRLKQDSLELPATGGGAVLDILVENLGRINFGKYLLQNKKGIVGNVTLAGQKLKGWDMFSLPFTTAPHNFTNAAGLPNPAHNNNSSISNTGSTGSTGNTNVPVNPRVPVLKKGSFTLDHTGDTYLDMQSWGKGMVWVNGHNLGRYWEIGPQQTLYLPAEWQKEGVNDIEILELLKPEQQFLQGIEKPILDQINNTGTLSIHSNPGTILTPPGYKLVWADEFNKDGPPDSTNWNYEKGFVRNEENQWYQPANAWCKNGILTIEARREQKPNPNYVADSKDWRKNRPTIDYTSACLRTSGLHTWKYGRFEMRGRIDIDRGCWPAWWALGVHGRWPGNGEIDMMEFYRKKLLANIACQGANGKAQWFSRTKPADSLGFLVWASAAGTSTGTPPTADSAAGAAWAAIFHVWRMDWDEDSIALYVDDLLLNKVALSALVNKDGSNFEPFKQPEYMLLNLAIGGQNGGNPAATPFPRRFEVDYVRVYQKE
jgi:beta-galactosidase